MLHQIQYTQPGTCLFLGRNGAFNQHGIEIVHFFSFVDDAHTVRLAPIRKNGEIGRASLDVPVKDLPAVIAALQDIAALHAHEQTPTPQPAEPEVDGSKQILIEDGKEYVTNGGKKVVMSNYTDDCPLCWTAYSGKSIQGYYTKTGLFGRSTYEQAHENDIAGEYLCETEKVSEINEITEPVKLQLRVGANYRAQNGYVYHITRKDLREFDHPFYADGAGFEYCFQENGKAFPYGTGVIDLIEEVPMPTWEAGKEYYNRNREICVVTHITATNEGKVLMLHGFDQHGRPQTWNGQGCFANWQSSILDLVEEV